MANNFGVWDEEMAAAMMAPQPPQGPWPVPPPPPPPLPPLGPMTGTIEYTDVFRIVHTHTFGEIDKFVISSTDMQGTEWVRQQMYDFRIGRIFVPELRIPLYVETWEDSREGRWVRGGGWLRDITYGWPRNEITLVLAEADHNNPYTMPQWEEYRALCEEIADTIIISPAPVTHEGHRDFAWYRSIVM
jgi:hypothetical protein